MANILLKASTTINADTLLNEANRVTYPLVDGALYFTSDNYLIKDTDSTRLPIVGVVEQSVISTNQDYSLLLGEYQETISGSIYGKTNRTANLKYNPSTGILTVPIIDAAVPNIDYNNISSQYLIVSNPTTGKIKKSSIQFATNAINKYLRENGSWGIPGEETIYYINCSYSNNTFTIDSPTNSTLSVLVVPADGTIVYIKCISAVSLVPGISYALTASGYPSLPISAFDANLTNNNSFNIPANGIIGLIYDKQNSTYQFFQHPMTKIFYGRITSTMSDITTIMSEHWVNVWVDNLLTLSENTIILLKKTNIPSSISIDQIKIQGQAYTVNSPLGSISNFAQDSILILSYNGSTFDLLNSADTNTNTDTKVTVAAATTSNKEYPIALANSTVTTSQTSGLNKADAFRYNPSTQILSVPKINASPSTSTASYNGHKIALLDSSTNNILQSSIAFGTATTTYLRNDGTWDTPNQILQEAIPHNSDTVTYQLLGSNSSTISTETGITHKVGLAITRDADGAHYTLTAVNGGILNSFTLADCDLSDYERTPATGDCLIFSAAEDYHLYESDLLIDNNINNKFLCQNGTWDVPVGDHKVTQNAAITTNSSYPILLGYDNSTTALTNTVNKSSSLTYNPSNKILTVPFINAAPSTSTTSYNGYKIALTTSNNKLASSSIAFGTSTVTYLRNDGTWTTPIDDHKVSQNTNTSNNNYPIIFSANTTATTATVNTVNKNADFYYNPSTEKLSVSNIDFKNNWISWLTSSDLSGYGYSGNFAYTKIGLITLLKIEITSGSAGASSLGTQEISLSSNQKTIATNIFQLSTTTKYCMPIGGTKTAPLTTPIQLTYNSSTGKLSFNPSAFCGSVQTITYICPLFNNN